jgi:hypothetical protein
MMSQAMAERDAELNRLRLELQTLKVEKEGNGELVNVGSYLLARLEQLGVTVSPPESS